MQITTFREIFGTLSQKTGWFDAADLAREMGLGLSERQVLRWLKELHGPLVHQLEDVRNAENNPLNSLLISPLRDWLGEKRVRVRVVQYLGEISCLVLTDFRGHATYLGLTDLNRLSIENGLGSLNGSFTLIPHGIVHRFMDEQAFIGNHEILTAAHSPIGYVPPKPKDSSLPRKGHLRELEIESISIIRSAVSRARNPAMLFSMGKDSMVMLHLAQKAFWPEKVPFPLVVIDTRWKFQNMYKFREWLESLPSLEFLIHINPEAIAKDVNPFDFGSGVHTEITKTNALKQILNGKNFDFVFGGARRDEEKSRAKERIFSVRTGDHRWDPKNQRPEFWDSYNTVLSENQSMRVFPLSNWTESDIWQYINQERIPIVPLYYSKRRAFVIRDGALIAIDDSRFRLLENEKIYFDFLRFRTLGCYPLTGGTLSSAQNVDEIISELANSPLSERSARLIDSERGSSMEQKKKEGYF